MTEVPVTELRPRCDPASFSFQTTADVEPRTGLIGQDRAVEAIQFGLGIDSVGFNICVSGEPGTGRTTAVREYLESFAKTKAPPDEWLYVNNFADTHRPRAIRLPAGKGREFDSAMHMMVNEAKERVPRTFSSDDYVNRRDEIIGSVQRHRDEVYSQLSDIARQAGFQMQGNPGGFFLVPLVDQKPMDDQSFSALTPEQRSQIIERRDQTMDQLRAIMKREAGEEVAATERLAELQRTVATMIVDSLLDGIFETYEKYEGVGQFLIELRRDMIEHIEDFLPLPPQAGPGIPIPLPSAGSRQAMSPLRRYEVNLLVDCTGETCAVVVFEQNPTPQRLLGRIEKEAIFGAVTTDHTMIQSGSLHRANGGYLVIDFDDLLQYPLSWNELKRTIRTGQITIEELGEKLGYIETKTVRPEPIPWTGKIIGIAREGVYRTLYMVDPDFRELFKVKADFELNIDRTKEHELDYAGLIASVAKREDLLPLDRAAVARVVDEGVRMAEDHNKLSIRFGEITDIVREANHWARQQGVPAVGAEHVRHAINARLYRVNLIEEHVRESIEKGIIVVDTDGSAIGQVNGLSVVSLGDTSFGQPSRITASMGVGREGVIDLQREARLSGPIHSKAVLTLQGFLVDRYATEAPLALTARLAFEQSYGMVEGDSATCAETCALLSRIAELPLNQAFAITGSMDQRGDIQAIGGANFKIEGFYDVCRAQGLTGRQGIILPKSNVQHLMLREDVVQAVQDGRFVVHSIETVDDALELLTGVPAGRMQEDGTYPADSVNGRVAARLKEISEHMREWSDFYRPSPEVSREPAQVEVDEA